MKETHKAVSDTKIYEEGFVSGKKPYYSSYNVAFQESLSLIPARKFTSQGKKTAVLNFANPIEPGGGVLRGANAQEEYLCRASNLYYCLTSSHAKPWYVAHNAILKTNQFNSMFLATDNIIYSKNVTIIRNDIGYQPDNTDPFGQEYTDDWMQIDIITSAAPYFSGSGYILPNGDLEQLFIRRIKNILEVAIENDVRSLVLGAFGCGAFHNPPMVVARAFQKVLLMDRYLHAFEDVVFAVKRTSSFCENIEAFEIAFSQFPPTEGYVFSVERNKRRFFE